MGGAGMVANAFDLAAVNFAAAGSTAFGHTAGQVSLGVQRIGPVFSFGAFAQFASHGFRDVAAMNDDPVPHRQLSGSFGINLVHWGNFGVAYTDVERDALQLPAEHARILTANYSMQLGHFALYAAGFHDFENRGGGNGITLGLSVPLGPRSSLSAQAVADPGTSAYGQIQAQQSAVSPGDWGYSAYASAGSTDHQFAQVEYLAPWARVSAGVDQLDSHTAFRGEAQGSLSALDGGIFPSDFIHDSFGVVDTNGVEGIHVLNENRDAGTTDSSGRVLLPYLRSWDVNRISIDPLDVPVDASVPYVNREVRPADRSGVVVSFPVRMSHAALLVLVDKDGQPLPQGSAATLETAHKSVPVGYDGQAYVEDLTAQNRLAVEYPDGRRCSIEFAYQAQRGEIPKIGPLLCTEAPP
jgi:outer membrane usher protein